MDSGSRVGLREARQPGVKRRDRHEANAANRSTPFDACCSDGSARRVEVVVEEGSGKSRVCHRGGDANPLARGQVGRVAYFAPGGASCLFGLGCIHIPTLATKPPQMIVRENLDLRIKNCPRGENAGLAFSICISRRSLVIARVRLAGKRGN